MAVRGSMLLIGVIALIISLATIAATLNIWRLKQTSFVNVAHKRWTNSQGSDDDVCMLVPVYPPHFPALNARLIMTNRTNTGPLVKTVVVFGDRNEQTQFCSQYASACREDVGFVGTSLEQLLGHETLDKIKLGLGWKGKPAHVFRPDSERKGCWSKSDGRVFQTIKKFVGAAYGPTECRKFWTSDAESLPFRKHNLSDLLHRYPSFATHVQADWNDEQDCANVEYDDGTDMSCAEFIAGQANAFRFQGDSEPSIWTRKRWRHIFWFVDQWWIYDRKITAAWLDLLQEHIGRPAWEVFTFYALSDASVYGMMMNWAAYYAFPNETKVLDIRKVINHSYPKVFNDCCRCNGASGVRTPPCAALPELLGGLPCLRKISREGRLKLAVGELGMFGANNYLRFSGIPPDQMSTTLPNGFGIHWCYNNCFQEENMKRILTFKGVDTIGIKQFAQVFSETKV